MNRVVVFWEDTFSGRKDFGAHVLALQCLVDRQPAFGSRFELGKRVSPIASRGVDKLLEKVRRTTERFVVAVPDDDRIREHLKLTREAQPASVLQALAAINATATFVLLEPNIERVVDYACDALRVPRPIAKQPPDERDRAIFQLAAEPSAETRLKFLGLMPSFTKVVDAIEAKLKASEERQ